MLGEWIRKSKPQTIMSTIRTDRAIKNIIYKKVNATDKNKFSISKTIDRKNEKYCANDLQGIDTHSQNSFH